MGVTNNAMKHYIAFDLGATSGRTILGSVDDGVLSLEELTRFPNASLPIGGHLYWNIFSLYEHLLEGLRVAASKGVGVESIGIDTWGVDFVFVGEDGSLLGAPYSYRDSHTEGAPERFFQKAMPRQRLYELTGIQVMNFNSVFQLHTLRENSSSQLAAAKHLLFMPDALSWLLTGRMVTEYTIASTSAMLNPRTKELDGEILSALGIEEGVFPPMVMPGSTVGTLRREIAESVGLRQVPVVAVAGHDTASAVAAVPALNPHFAYLSSGTWSLMGVEVSEPVITPQTEKFNLTNEGGIEGTTRLLKNITGMWIVEQCLAEWRKQGRNYTYPEMVCLAEGADRFERMIDPDDALFASPRSMTAAIDEYLARTGQPAPKSDGDYLACAFESLALKYRFVLGMFQAVTDFPIERLHIIGGGSKNPLLNQYTASSIGLEVVSGPSEATAIGNIMIQAKAAGQVESLPQMRQMIAESVEMATYLPQECDLWERAYEQFLTITNLKYE